MVRRFRANPLDNGTDDRMTFDDVTTLVLASVVALGVAVLLCLGVLCATHRLEAIL